MKNFFLRIKMKRKTQCAKDIELATTWPVAFTGTIDTGTIEGINELIFNLLNSLPMESRDTFAITLHCIWKA